MKLKLVARSFGYFVLAGLLGQAAVAQPEPAESFASLPAIESVSLSRDGDYMTALIAPPGKPNADKMALAVWDVTDMSKPPKIANADRDSEFIAAFALKADKILVFVRKPWTGPLNGCGEGRAVGATKTYIYKTFVTDTEFSKFEDPFAATMDRSRTGVNVQRCLDLAGSANLRSLLPLDDENVLIEQLDPRSFNTKIVKYNLKTNESEVIHRDVRGSPQADLLDPESLTVLTKTDISVGDGKYYFERWILNEQSGEYELHQPLLSSSDDRHDISIVGRDNASGKYYVQTDQFSDKDRIYLYDAVTRTYDDEPIASDETFDIGGIQLGQYEGEYNKLLGVSVMGGAEQVEWYDPELAGIVASYAGHLTGQNVTIEDYNADRSRILLKASSAKHPPTYFLLTNKKSNMLIGSSRPNLDTTNYGESELVYVTARDGMEFPSILTLPSNWKKGDKAPPAIVIPHGGPWARDFMEWDDTGWVHFFTTRGFSVLQPQYRGSTGWGRELWLAGDAEWGQKMQDDKDDAANWMVAQGYADAEHIAIFGYSYGGFAAFAAAVREGGPFKCAIGGAGVSDLGKLSSSWSSNRLQRVLQGKTVKGMDPLQNASSANIPVLVIHGDRDVRVPISHGKRFYDSVKKHVPAKYVKIDDMPHSLPWTPDMQKKSLEAMEKFLRKECAMPM